MPDDVDRKQSVKLIRIKLIHSELEPEWEFNKSFLTNKLCNFSNIIVGIRFWNYLVLSYCAEN